MLYFILAVFLLIFIFCAYIFFKAIKLKDINESLNLCANKIDDTLNKKLELIKNILDKIGDKSLKKELKFDDSMNIYEKEKSLFDMSFNINKSLKEKKNNDIDEEISKLNLTEETLDGLKDFYNAHVLNYNEIYLKKYINKIYKLLKFKDYKSFKIRKLEEYEIFKM